MTLRTGTTRLTALNVETILSLGNGRMEYNALSVDLCIYHFNHRGAPAPHYKQQTMKAKTVLYRTYTYIDVAFDQGEPRKIFIPENLSDKPSCIKDGKLRIGDYQYNPKTETWEKISKILLFLQQIVEAIRNVFSKSKSTT